MFGGRCDGSRFVSAFFDAQMFGECLGCSLRTQDDEGRVRCEVIEGQERVSQCDGLQAFVDYESIRPPWRRR